MSPRAYQLVDEASAERYERVRSQAKADLRTTTDPLPYALAGLAVLSHGVPGVRTRAELTLEQLQLVAGLFRVVLAAVARRLVQVHPGLADEVLGHERLREKLSVGPLKRLGHEDQATKLLRILLSDSHHFIEYRDRGLFDWDDGDAQAALVIVYGWGGRTIGQRGTLQRASSIHREAREILAAARASAPDNPVLDLVHRRFALAWRSLTPEESAQERTALQRIGGGSGRTARDQALRILARTA